MKREVAEGERLPWGYGVSYPLVTKPAWVIYPVPLNLLVRWARSFYFMLACSTRMTMELQAYRLGYSNGYNAGIREGRKQGKKDAVDFIREVVKGVKLP